MRVSIMPLPGLDEEVDEILGADYQILQRWHKIHSGKLEKEVEEALMFYAKRTIGDYWALTQSEML